MKGLKWYHWLLIILFPLGALFCLGRALFKHDWLTFLGVIIAFLIGMVLGSYLMNPEWYAPFFNFWARLFGG